MVHPSAHLAGAVPTSVIADDGPRAGAAVRECLHGPCAVRFCGVLLLNAWLLAIGSEDPCLWSIVSLWSLSRVQL